MRFGYTIIYVENVAATLSFYEKAFNLRRLFLHDSLQYGELDTDNTRLAFASEALAEANGVVFTPNRHEARSAGFEIAFVTDDVDAAYQHALQAGASAVKEPAAKPWGQIVAYVRDLNGVLIELCSPMA